MLEQIVEKTNQYIEEMPKKERKKYGQFFTSIETARYMAKLPLQGVKLHMLHIVDNAPLGKLYLKEPFDLLTEDEYVVLIGEILKILPSDFVIHRLTGDGDKKHLIAPLWTTRKTLVLNHIHKYLKENNIYQGCL